MNNTKLFDRYQLILGISAIASLIVSIILFVIMVLTGKVIYDDTGAIKEIVYNNVLQSIYAIFFMLQLTAITWFIARLLTYKMRIKEEDSL